MQKAAAETITRLVESAIATLSESLTEAQHSMSPADFERFKRTVGIAIGNISTQALDPIYAQFPELAPPGLNS